MKEKFNSKEQHNLYYTLFVILLNTHIKEKKILLILKINKITKKKIIYTSNNVGYFV